MKTLTIRVLGIIVILATLATGTVYVTSAFLIRDQISASRTIWSDYQRISDNRARSLASIIRNMRLWRHDPLVQEIRHQGRR